MKIPDILRLISEIKRQRKGGYTNYYNQYNNSEIEFDVFREEGTVLFCVQEEFVYRVFFFSNNLEELTECLKKVKENAVCDFVCKGELGQIESVFTTADWGLYATYLRTSNPIPYEEKRTRLNLLLEKMYNPNYGMLATEDDVPAIRKLMIDIFDPVCDDIMSEERIKEAIKDESVWMYKVGDKICTLYIYQIQGRKRYGNMTYNCLSADYLYSVVRKANEISSQKHDLICHYGWVDAKNNKIIHSLKEQGCFNADGVKNYIFKKTRRKDVVL